MPVRTPDVRSNKEKSVSNLAPLEVYLAGGIVDGEGMNIPARVVCRVKGTKQFFFMFPKGTEESMRKAAPWLQKELEKMVGDAESATPDDMGQALPIGAL